MPNTTRAPELDRAPDPAELLAAHRAGLSLVQYRERNASAIALEPDDGNADRLEKLEQLHCRKVFRAFGGRVYSLSQARASKQTPGLGDLFVIFPGLVSFWWDTKRQKGGRISPAQQEFHALCNGCERTSAQLLAIADALECMAIEHVTHTAFYADHGEIARANYARENGQDLQKFAAVLRALIVSAGSRHYIGGRKEAEALVIVLGLAYRDEASGVLEPVRRST